MVDATGDDLPAEFASAVDAINGAVEIRRDLAEHNAEFSHARMIKFRIGIHLGDFVKRDGKLFLKLNAGAVNPCNLRTKALSNTIVKLNKEPV